LPGRWMVYMGRFADADQLAKKRSELKELGVPYDRPNAALEPGLSLGRFSTEEAAQRGLNILGAKGVRSARVVQERVDLPGFMLRLPEADAQLRTQVEGLRNALAGKALRPCN
ncbi:MAG: SPOR domain-containing protein, partial [Giesbergeria sp.]